MTVNEFTTWINTLPNTEKYNLMEFLELIYIAKNTHLVCGFQVNITPKNEITFDTQKLSYSSTKQLMLNK